MTTRYRLHRRKLMRCCPANSRPENPPLRRARRACIASASCPVQGICGAPRGSPRMDLASKPEWDPNLRSALPHKRFVLRDDRGDPIRMPNGEPEADRCAIVEDVNRETN